MSEATTRGIRVQVESTYLPERSVPSERQFLFTYRVRVANLGDEAATLVSRRWLITDGDGRTHVVEGPGVIGEQPHLAPGEAFEYSSYCPLPTPVGTMEGTYAMVTDAGESFDARIAPFFLAVPGAVN